jgi:2-polyprenyl-6-methoxyphenol hydroxylase-like FAD-dependent oxidoreductase
VLDHVSHRFPILNSIMTDSKPFHVLIVGGGPAGLAMANSLSLLAANLPPTHPGLTWTLIERGAMIAPPHGTCLGIWPQSIRILDQFGVLETLLRDASPMKMSYNLMPDGSEIMAFPLFDLIRERYASFLFSRLLQLM